MPLFNLVMLMNNAQLLNWFILMIDEITMILAAAQNSGHSPQDGHCQEKEKLVGIVLLTNIIIVISWIQIYVVLI